MPSSLALALLVVAATTVSAAGHPGVVLARLLEVQKVFLDDDDSAQWLTVLDLEQARELADLLGEGATVVPNGCSCSTASKSCQCCASVKIPKIKFQSTVCAIVAYDPNEIGFVFTLTSNGKVIFQKKITVRNPPPLCVGIPGVKLAQLCVVFYNLDWDGKHISGCARAEAKLVKATIFKFELGCFNLGPFSENMEENALPASVETPAVLLPAVTKPADVSPIASDTHESATEARNSFVLKFRPGMSEKAMSQLIEIIRQLQAIDLAFSVSVSFSLS